jgi:RNA polymerase sigma-70 factor (ECF subfamily)
VTALALAPPALRTRPAGVESPQPVEEKKPLATKEVEDVALFAALRDGDENAFAQLVGRYHGPLKRLARSFGAGEAVAEEIVQETWLGALRGFDRFEQRSSLKTWLFGILKNQARARAARERRSVPFSALADAGEEGGPVVAPERFQGEDGFWPGHWAAPPRPWEDPHRRLASLEAREHLRRAIAALPERQRAVVALRDVEGLAATEVCELLELSEGNQRVLLHRGRAAVRDALEGLIDA